MSTGAAIKGTRSGVAWLLSAPELRAMDGEFAGLEWRAQCGKKYPGQLAGYSHTTPFLRIRGERKREATERELLDSWHTKAAPEGGEQQCVRAGIKKKR